jgi:hypothetical protein
MDDVNLEIRNVRDQGADLREKHMLILNDFHGLETHISELQTLINYGNYLIWYFIIEMENSMTKLANLIEALDAKQIATDSLSIKNFTKLEYHSVQIEITKEDVTKLVEKCIHKWKVSGLLKSKRIS